MADAVKKPVPTKKVEPIEEKPKTQDFWKRNKANPVRWKVLYVPYCTYIDEVRKLFEEHEEPMVGYSSFSQEEAQAAIARDYNYSPVIFKNNVLLGGLPELRAYYERNFFNSIQEALKE